MIDPNDPSYRPRPPRDHRMLAIGLCIAAIVCFGYAAFSHRWLENTHGGVNAGFSLIAFEACSFEKCEAISNFEMIEQLKQRTLRREEPPSGMFAPAGVITMGLSLLAVLALGGAVLLAWKRKRLALRVPITSVALLAIMAGLCTGCLFIAKKPGGQTGYDAVGVGPSFWAYAIACVVGIAGAQMLARYIKPIDPDLGPSASGNAL